MSQTSLFLIAASRMFFPVGLIKFRRLQHCIILSKLHDWCNELPHVEDHIPYFLFIHTLAIHLAGRPFPERFMYLMFRQQQRTDSPLKIPSNQRSQAGEHEESSEWTSFRSSQTRKPDSSMGSMGDLFWAPNYIISHLYFSFLSGSGEKIWKLVLCILCAEGAVCAPPRDW